MIIVCPASGGLHGERFLNFISVKFNFISIVLKIRRKIRIKIEITYKFCAKTMTACAKMHFSCENLCENKRHLCENQMQFVPNFNHLFE